MSWISFFVLVLVYIYVSEARRDHRISLRSNNNNNNNNTIPVIETCNGFVELCDLPITKVTLPGTHNSGAGFAGPLRFHSNAGKVLASSCSHRFQSRSIYEQLDLGIRYFDFDVCGTLKYKESEIQYDEADIGLCHGNAVGGRVSDAFEQIDVWMNEPYNRNEVIVLYFKSGQKTKKSGQKRGQKYKDNKTKIGGHLIDQILEKWEPSDSRNTLRRLAIQPSVEERLGDAIRYNQRIYIIMHNELALQNRKSWIIPHWTVGRTSTAMSFITSNGCYNLIREMSEHRCQQEAAHTFVRYDMYLTSGLCRRHLASYCRKYISDGVSKCFIGASTRRRTVNFIVVDYADDEVVLAARKQNVENIQFFMRKAVQYYRREDICEVLQKMSDMGIPLYVGGERIVLRT